MAHIDYLQAKLKIHYNRAIFSLGAFVCTAFWTALSYPTQPSWIIVLGPIVMSLCISAGYFNYQSSIQTEDKIDQLRITKN